MKRSEEELQAALIERARRLAEQTQSEQTATRAFACVEVGGLAIGLPLASVVRAAAVRQVTEVPGAEPHLVGIVAVEGHLVSLIDLGTFLGLRPKGVGDLTGMVVVANGDSEIGLGAHSLLGICELNESDIKPAAGGLALIDHRAMVRDRELYLLDVEALFSDTRLTGEVR
jgi:purine-binding chemotaxis protein CheW